MDAVIIRKLRAKAHRCRELAAKATDTEVAESLTQLADEIEAAIPVLEGNKARVESAKPSEIV
jgi:hypothetical protein